MLKSNPHIDYNDAGGNWFYIYIIEFNTKIAERINNKK